MTSPLSSSGRSEQDSALGERVRYATRIWWVMIALEVVHQCFSAFGILRDPSVMYTQVRAQGIPDSLFHSVLIIGVVIALVIICCFLGLVGCAVHSVARSGKRWWFCLQVLLCGSIYCAVRGVFVFFTHSGVPDLLLFSDGVVQIVSAVCGVLSFWYLWSVQRAARSDR